MKSYLIQINKIEASVCDLKNLSGIMLFFIVSQANDSYRKW